MTAIQEYLQDRLASSQGEVHAQWLHLQDLQEQRLWHQMTEFAVSFVDSAAFSQGGLKEFCSKFLGLLFDRLNPLTYTQIALKAVREIETAEETEGYLKVLQKRVEKDTQANICALTALAEYYVARDDLTTAKTVLNTAKALVDAIDGVTQMHADYYRVSAEWAKRKGKFAEFYTDALRFLGCKDIADLSQEDAIQRAFDLSLAALLGEKIFSFGELLAHPILAPLQHTDKSWIVDLLHVFNSGDVAKFESLRPVWSQQADLASSTDSLLLKLRLLSLINLVFSSPSNSRRIRFAEIAQAAHVGEDHVEGLLIKAMSLQLVKGGIDQVDKVVNVTWVVPRVLDLSQVAVMRDRMAAWAKVVEETAISVETQHPEIFHSH